MAATLFFTPQADACVGRILSVGIPDAVGEQLLAEMISLLITERTGSNVKIVRYKDSREIYAAVKEGKVGILIERTDRALDVLGKPKEPNEKTAYEVVKKEYRMNLNLVWLAPWGGPQHYAPVLTVETLTNFPALPKLLNKLAGVLNSENYTKLIEAAERDNNAKKVVREFLKAKKLI